MAVVRVLDAVELHRSGESVRVRPGKTTELFIRLALEAGSMVRTELLIEDLWAEDASVTARNTLQATVSRLRRSLGDAALVTGTPAGYTLNVDPGTVDALEVVRLAEEASLARSGGDPSAALESCSRALALFGGDVLRHAGDNEWVIPHRAQLEEVRLSLLEAHLAARLDLGTPAEVIGDLEALVHAHTEREGFAALLMVALYRDGRQADALAAYQRTRNWLLDELGLDPGSDLQQLEQEILRHDESLGVPQSTVRALAPTRPAGNLPAMSAELIGRDTDLAAIVDLVTESRLVEVVGPGGVGKTAAAIAAGRSLSGSELSEGGVWLARLETATSPDDVVDTVVAALNVGGEGALLERLKNGRAVLILDNCEHVLDSATELAARLLDAAPGLRILCTSQAPLGLDGEVVYELAPLAISDAVALFTDRAGSHRANRASVVAGDAVEDLCLSLDGLPLAIELAAARTRTLSVEEITRRLDDRFRVLADPTSRRPERRRALRSTIGWSYELLFPDDQRGLWALATFAGGAPLSAVEAVLAALDVPEAAAIDVVGRLAARSLVIVDDDAPETAEVRYRLLDSIRAFALEAMADAGLADQASAAHAAWFAAAARTSTDGVRSGAQGEYLAFARAERANIDTALTWTIDHDPLGALDLVNGFGWAWIVLGDSRGAQRILAALDATGDAAPDVERANALLLAAWIEASSERLDLAEEHIAAATQIAERIGDVDLQGRCAYYGAYVVSHHGDFHHALELTDRADALYQGRDRPWDQAANWLFAARAAISAHDEPRSVEAVDQVQHWLQTVDDPWLHVRYDHFQGELARIQHRFDDAVTHLSHAAETSHRLGFRQTEAYQLSSLGRAQCQAGDYDAGSATIEHAVEKAEATGDPRLAALARVHLGRVLRALGQDTRARAALDAATAWHRAAGGGEQAALGECLLAALDIGDDAAARRSPPWGAARGRSTVRRRPGRGVRP